MENVVLLKWNNFTPCHAFFKNFSLCKWVLVMKKYLKETASVADFLLHVRGFVILHKYLRATMLSSYVVHVFNHLKKLNRELNKSSQHIENRAVYY